MSDFWEPATAEEWQTVVDASNAMLAMKRAQDYGLITFEGSLTVHTERCEALLKRGAALGYHPHEAAIETLVRGFCGQAGASDADTSAVLEIVLSVSREARA